MVASINKQMFPFDESSEIKLKLQLLYKEQGGRMSAVIDAAVKYKHGSLTLYAEEVLTSRNLDKGLGIFFMKDFGKSVEECDTFTELFNEASEPAPGKGKDNVIKQ